jgi:gamma-glutamyltranspeptidase
VGELVQNSPLAETLRTIATAGRTRFTGDIARGIIERQKRFRPIAARSAAA